MAMKVTVQYFDGCPHWEQARARIEKVVRESRRSDISLDYELIDSPEMAERVGFRGSPTVLIDGRDPFLMGDEPIGLSCRVFRTERGREGAPSERQLRQALSR